jgi:glycerophosphoryl diester phosphodiesterase
MKKNAYEASMIMGAGIIECDVTFSKDLELICRHAQCDLHYTTVCFLNSLIS